MKLTDQRAPSEGRGVRLIKKLTNLRASPERTGVRLTKAAGWILTVFGAAHVVIAPLERRDVWSQVVDEGWWNTFTLDESTTLAQFERSETLWVTLASWGVPVLVLGCYVVWATRQRQRVPGWIGWIVLAWGLVFATALPASPAWLLVVSGALIALGDRRKAEPHGYAVGTSHGRGQRRPDGATHVPRADSPCDDTLSPRRRDRRAAQPRRCAR